MEISVIACLCEWISADGSRPLLERFRDWTLDIQPIIDYFAESFRYMRREYGWTFIGGLGFVIIYLGLYSDITRPLSSLILANLVRLIIVTIAGIAGMVVWFISWVLGGAFIANLRSAIRYQSSAWQDWARGIGKARD